MGARQWHHVYWYAQIVIELRDYEMDGGFGDEDEFEKHMEVYAYNYWSGDDGGDAGWEIAAPRARIIRYLGPAEDVLYEMRLNTSMDKLVTS